MPRRSAEKPSWTEADAEEIGTAIGIDWDTAKFDQQDFLDGLLVELEHGSKDERTNVTDDDPEITGKIAWAHLLEDPEYYVVLKAVEERVKAQEKDGTASFFPSIRDISGTLTELTQRYAELTQHRGKILRRASALARTIAALEPTPELLSDDVALRRLAENALTAADHLEDLAAGVPVVKQRAAAIRAASKR